jgi:hypothetical protein
VYQLLGKPVPDELFVSNISGLGAPPAQTAPTALLAPTVDGEETSYFEWLGAGALDIHPDGYRGGAMHQTTRQAPVLRLLQFGFERTRERLFVRLDSDRRMADLLADGYAFFLKFHQPVGVRFVVRMVAGKPIGTFWARACGLQDSASAFRLRLQAPVQANRGQRWGNYQYKRAQTIHRGDFRAIP